MLHASSGDLGIWLLESQEYPMGQLLELGLVSCLRRLACVFKTDLDCLSWLYWSSKTCFAGSLTAWAASRSGFWDFKLKR